MTQGSPPADDRPALAAVLARLSDLLGLDRKGFSLERLQRQTRAQLLEWARQLGLTGLGDLTKDVLARRIEETLTRLGVVTRPPPDTPHDPTLSHKFDRGLPRAQRVEPEHIPWGYGRDRATAMAIDPDRLYVYWEVTEEAIARAREGLGPGGPGAWLSLRVYDVTGRLFDGTNAHSYFDHRVGRDERQWFFTIGKPTSTAVVEIGMQSHEGYFVRVARSSRVDFPRREPSPDGGVEWLTVHTESGEVEPTRRDSAAQGPGGPARDDDRRGAGASDPGLGVEERPMPGPSMHAEWQQVVRTEWTEGGHMVEWVGPLVQALWEDGPFTSSVESPAYVEEHHDGPVTVYAHNGTTRVVFGPWQVVIRGIDAHAERHVIATWELERSWDTDGNVLPGRPGARGRDDDERRHDGGSDSRLRGASEVWYLGASERRFLGASEVVGRGASERRARGASERRIGGASETRAGGASERTRRR